MVVLTSTNRNHMISLVSEALTDFVYSGVIPVGGLGLFQLLITMFVPIF